MFVSDLDYLLPFWSYCQKSESTREILTKFLLFLAFFFREMASEEFKNYRIIQTTPEYTIPENFVRIGWVVSENERWIKKKKIKKNK